MPIRGRSSSIGCWKPGPPNPAMPSCRCRTRWSSCTRRVPRAAASSPTAQGVTLSTVHSAKGTEFDHVLVIGPWRLPAQRVKQEEERRTFYVGITRARKTLAVFDRRDVSPSLPATLTDKWVIRSRFTAAPAARKGASSELPGATLEDIHLGYPGQFSQGHRIHQALASLTAGDRLTMRPCERNGIGLFDKSDNCIARLSRQAEKDWAGRLHLCAGNARPRDGLPEGRPG